MDHILTRQLTIAVAKRLTLSIPRAQVLNLLFRRNDGAEAQLGAESIEIRLSVGRLVLYGQGLAPLWEGLVSGQDVIDICDKIEGGGGIKSYFADLPSNFLSR